MKFAGLVGSLMLFVPSIAFAQWIPLPPQPAPPTIADPWADDPPPPAIPPEQIPVEEPPPAEPPPVEPIPEPDPTDEELTPEQILEKYRTNTGTSASTTSSESDAPARYPLSLPARPLLLPEGTSSFDFGVDVSHFAQPDISVISGGFSFGALHSFGATELSAGMSIHGFDSQNADEENMATFPRVRVISAAIRRLVAPELTIGSQIVLGNVGSEYQRFSPNLSASKKFHLSDRAAIFVNFGLDVETAVAKVQFGLRDYERISMFGTFAVEAGVSENVSLYASTTLQQNELLEELEYGYTSYRNLATQLSLLIATSDAMDVSLGWSIFSSGPRDSKTFDVTLIARRFQ